MPLPAEDQLPTPVRIRRREEPDELIPLPPPRGTGLWVAAGLGILAAVSIGIWLAVGGMRSDPEKNTAEAPNEKQGGSTPKEEPAPAPKPQPDSPAPIPKLKAGSQETAPLLANVAILSAKLEPLTIDFSIGLDVVRGTIPFEKKSGLWFCFGKPSTLPSLRSELEKALGKGDNFFYLNMRGPGFVAAQCSELKASAERPGVWTGSIPLGKADIHGDELDIPSPFGSTTYKLTAMPVSWVYYDDARRMSNELKAVVDLKTGKVVSVEAESGRDESWKPWAADLDLPKAGAAAPALTSDFLPHKPGTTRTKVQTLFGDDGKPSSITTSRLQFRADGILASRIIELKNSTSTIASENLFPESLTRHAERSGFLCIGYPKDPKKPEGETEWFQLVKLGAKPGDRWSEVRGKSDETGMREYLAAGTLQGKPCVVIGIGRSYTVYVEGIGERIHRFFQKKGEKWIPSIEELIE